MRYVNSLVAIIISMSVTFSAAGESYPTPERPWSLEQLSTKLAELNDTRQAIVDLLNTPKIKTDDVSSLLTSDPFLTIIRGKTGYTPFELKSPTHFVEGNSLSFKLALRDQETISGPRRKEIDQYLRAYLCILNETIKYYSDINRQLERESGLQARYPEGLNVYEKPSCTNPQIQAVYDELWRDIDALPGGTAGALIDEVRTGKEFIHYRKAGDRLKQLKGLLKSQNSTLSREARLILIKVMDDLRGAIIEADCAAQSELDGVVDVSSDESI